MENKIKKKKAKHRPWSQSPEKLKIVRSWQIWMEMRLQQLPVSNLWFRSSSEAARVFPSGTHTGAALTRSGQHTDRNTQRLNRHGTNNLILLRLIRRKGSLVGNTHMCSTWIPPVTCRRHLAYPVAGTWIPSLPTAGTWIYKSKACSSPPVAGTDLLLNLDTLTHPHIPAHPSTLHTVQ